jgi:valacyclovir hydrolase
MPIAALSGFNLFYEDQGDGEVLLLIPGALGTAHSDFDRQITYFAKTHRIIAPDPRGHGQSQPPKCNYPPDFYQRNAGDLIQLMDRLDIDEFSILGWSDGANIAAIMAVALPERVRCLVLWAGNSFISQEELRAFEAIRSLSAWSERSLSALRTVYGEDLAAIWTSYVDALGALYAAGGKLYRAKLPEIAAPTLILHGEKDPLVPRFHAEILSREIRNAQLYCFPEGKHNIHIRYAAEFNQVVSEFFTNSKIGLGKSREQDQVFE